MDDEFYWDDEEAKAGCGINNITEAYTKVFKSIADLATEASEQTAGGGSGKAIATYITALTARASALVTLSTYDKKIIGPNGKIYNAFGIESDEEYDDGNSDMYITEEELLSKINSIANKFDNISVSEIAEKELQSKLNDQVNKNGNNDLNDIDW